MHKATIIMNEPVYDVSYLPSENRYYFESIGRKGKITKVVAFTEKQNDIYNLGFGDFNPVTGQVDDKVKSENGDMPKVLATVLHITAQFLSDNPMLYVFFKGSTPDRTRLYQMAINHHYEEFSVNFEIFGLIDYTPEPFQKNKLYESFLIRKLF